MNIAESSREEGRYYLILAADLDYGQTVPLMYSAEEVSRLLNAYTRAILAPDLWLHPSRHGPHEGPLKQNRGHLSCW